MITFEKKISIDGVAVICCAVLVIMWLTTLSNRVQFQADEIASDEKQIATLESNETLLQQNLAVLTALQNVENNKPPQTTVIK